MKSRVSVMCSLALAGSLASCAPSFGSGRADVKVGHEMANVQRVYLSEVNAQTPGSSYVILPDCSGGVVALSDVRRLGPQRAAEVCTAQVAKPPVDWRGIRVMAGVVVSSFLIYSFVFRGKTSLNF